MLNETQNQFECLTASLNTSWNVFILFHELWTVSNFSMNCETFHAFPWIMNRFILFHELWNFSYFFMNCETCHTFSWIMKRFIFIHEIFFMLFHEFEKSQAAEQAAEQFSNFTDRGFALAVKNKLQWILRQFKASLIFWKMPINCWNYNLN